MNGNRIAEIKGMTEGEFRIYLIEKLEKVQHIGLSNKKHVCDVKEKQATLELKIASFPEHCIQVLAMEKMGNRIDFLEKENAGRKAVNNLLFGAGGVSILSMVIMLLKFVFNAF